MVTTVQRSNTIAFPSAKNSSTVHDRDLRLRMSNILQTTLELPQIIKLFFDELQLSMPINSVSFRHEEFSSHIEVGKSATHSCHYNLVTNNNSMGEVAFTRSSRFSEQDLQQLEMLISCLICPIKNALQYQLAIQNSLKDPLTGTGNRIALEDSLNREINLAKRHGNPLSLLVVDIDKFKNVNDLFGHTAGDSVLKDVAYQMGICCRDTDATYRTYRFGGEEFVVVLNNTDSEGARIVAERLRSSIETMTTVYEASSINVTISGGIATLRDEDDKNNLFDRADKALYKAKHGGRNQVIVASNPA